MVTLVKKENIEMENFKRFIWLLLAVFVVATENPVTSAQLYVLDDINLRDTSTPHRVRRQTHPATTIAKLPPQENGAFVPIVGPTQSLPPQPQIPFAQPNEFFSNGEFVSSLQGVPNTLIDYLVPPSPDSIGTSLNFQDPEGNLQQVVNGFDIPSSTSSPNHFPLSNSFSPSPSDFQHQNQINTPSVQTTPSTFTNGPVPSVSFQNSDSIPSSTPALTPSSPNPPTGVTNFISSKISTSLNRETFAQFHSPTQRKPNQFNVPTGPSTPQQQKLQHQEHQEKWELGYDPNEILAPPRDESLGRANEYDTINVSRFRRPSFNLNPPLTETEQKSSNPILPTSSQFFSQFIHPQPQQNQFNQFNQFPPPQNIAPNEAFIPIPNQFTSPNQLPPNSENISEQQYVIWGTQQQPSNNLNTTNSSPPFLPTVPPNNNLSPQQDHFQQSPNFQNPQQAPNIPIPQSGPNLQNLPPVYNFQNAAPAHNFQHNGFNSLPQPLPPSPTSFGLQTYFDLNQNYPLDSPLPGQFDSFLPQGTVADHTFQPFNETPHNFKKRQVNEEEGADQQYEEVPQPNYRLPHATRPVYSFVKTDRDGHFKWSVRHTSKR